MFHLTTKQLILVCICSVTAVFAVIFYLNMSGHSENNLIAEKIAEYEIVKKQGKMPDTCAQAKLVAMLYLQKQEESSYIAWDKVAQKCEDAYVQSANQIQ